MKRWVSWESLCSASIVCWSDVTMWASDDWSSWKSRLPPGGGTTWPNSPRETSPA